jgi:hypothetical protein
VAMGDEAWAEVGDGRENSGGGGLEVGQVVVRIPELRKQGSPVVAHCCGKFAAVGQKVSNGALLGLHVDNMLQFERV